MLEKIISGKQQKPRRIVLYGPDGVGKSSWASQADSPIFLATEDGCDDIGVDRTPLITTFEQFNCYTSALIQEPHDYKTAVIDSADWLERLVHKAVAAKENKTSIENIGYGKGYKLALDGWRFVLGTLDELRKKGMTIIILAHAKVERFEPPGSDAYDRYELALHKHAAPVIREWADEVFFATFDIDTIRESGDFGRERVKAVGGRRVVHTTEAPTHLAKRRMKLPDVMPLDYSVYAEYMATHYGNTKSNNIAGIVTNGSSKKEVITNG